VTYLENLIDSVSTLIVMPIFSIADDWQKAGYQFGRYSILRKCAYRANRILQRLSGLHVAPDRIHGELPQSNEEAINPSAATSIKAGSDRVICSKFDDIESDASSFGIDGNGWGTASSDESSLGLQ
jgi:hypothetical protein